MIEQTPLHVRFAEDIGIYFAAFVLIGLPIMFFIFLIVFLLL